MPREGCKVTYSTFPVFLSNTSDWSRALSRTWLPGYLPVLPPHAHKDGCRGFHPVACLRYRSRSDEMQSSALIVLLLNICVSKSLLVLFGTVLPLFSD